MMEVYKKAAMEKGGTTKKRGRFKENVDKRVEGDTLKGNRQHHNKVLGNA